MEFIYFSSFAVLVNFLDQLVTDMIKPVLEDLAPSGNGSTVMVIFLYNLEERYSQKS